jgi:hypothetical protein
MDAIRTGSKLVRSAVYVGALSVAALLLSPVAVGSGAQAGGNAEVVHNDAHPPGGVETVQARELWRAGGEDDERFFGVIARAISDEVGNVYLLDSQLSEAHVYSPEGEFIRTLGREGDGPGEVRGPADCCLFPDGTLGFVQAFPGKIVKVNPDGTPAETISYGTGPAAQGRFAVLIRAMMRGGAFVLGGIRMSFANDGSGSETRFLSLCDDSGTEQHCYVSKTTNVNYASLTMSELDQDFAWARSALGPGGNLYVAPDRNVYRIEVHSPAGELLRVIEREYVSPKRNARQLEAARRQLEAYARYYRTALQEITIEESEPDITDVWVAPDGHLWVRTSHGDNHAPEGILTTYDLFDESGRFRKQLAVACPGDPARDLIFMVGQDRMILVSGGVGAALTQLGVSPADESQEDETGILEVICLHLGG